MKKIRTTIFITWRENIKYFNNKFPTATQNSCRIKRTVKIEQDPQELWEVYGTCTIEGKKLIVVGWDNNELQINKLAN